MIVIIVFAAEGVMFNKFNHSSSDLFMCEDDMLLSHVEISPFSQESSPSISLVFI